MILEVQSTPTGGQASLSYKVNEPQSETYTAVTFNSFHITCPRPFPSVFNTLPSGSVTVTTSGLPNAAATMAD